jgi:hypothetical protein
MEVQMANGQSGLGDRGSQKPTDEFVQAAEGEAHALKEQARETAEEVKAGVQGAAEDVKEQVRSSAVRQKDAAAQQMDGFAHALKSASDDLQGRGQDSAAAWVRQAASGLERVSSTVRERNVDDLIGTVEDFARRQPVAFLGGAVAAGFGLARLMKSSADRRRSTAAESQFGEGRGTAAGTRYGQGTGTATERRFGEGTGTAAGTRYGEGGEL